MSVLHQLTLGQNEATEKTAGNCFLLFDAFALRSLFPSSASLIPCLFALSLCFVSCCIRSSSPLRLHGIIIFARSLIFSVVSNQLAAIAICLLLLSERASFSLRKRLGDRAILVGMGWY